MLLLVDQGTGTSLPLSLERGTFTIGRGADCDLILHDPQASRRHAELRRTGERWLIVDLGSTNGTAMDGVRLRPGVAEILCPGVVVTIGRARLSLQDELRPVPPREPPRQPVRAGDERAALSGRSTLSLWTFAMWLSRGIVAVGCALVLLGAWRDWVQLQVRLPFLGTVVDRAYSGADSGLLWLFLGASVLALVFVGLDVASKRWGLSGGVAQALLGTGIAVVLFGQLQGYYRLGTQKLLGISLLELYSRYGRDLVAVSIKPGVYLVSAGVAALVLGGTFRALLAGFKSSPSHGRVE